MDQQRITNRFEFKVPIVKIETTARRWGMFLDRPYRAPCVYRTNVNCQHRNCEEDIHSSDESKSESWRVRLTPTLD